MIYRLIAAVVARTLVKILIKIRAASRASIVRVGAIGRPIGLNRRGDLAPLDVKSVHDVLHFDEGTSGGDRGIIFRECDGVREEETILVVGTAAGGGGDQDELGILGPAALGIVEAGGVCEGGGEFVHAAADS